MTDLNSVIFTPLGNIIRLFCVLCFAAATVAPVIAIRQKRKSLYGVLSAVHFALNFFLLVTVLDGTYGEEFFPNPRRWFGLITGFYSLPWMVAAVLIVISLALSITMFVSSYRFKQRTVSKSAIKESVDLLLRGRYYFEHPEENDRAALTELIRDTNLNLFNKVERGGGDSYIDAVILADTIGVTVKVKGEPPADKSFRELVARAVHECSVNLVKHAGGDTLFVSFSNGTATFTNNGKPPAGEIVESGGLLSLRKLTEGKDGEMILTSSPRFELTIKL